eukprot:SAG11_NODE_8543_length_1003_cov_1.049779_1_plen_210_part_00
MKGHGDDVGNERADTLVQWGKTSGPFSRVQSGGDVEGDGIAQPLRGRVRRLEKQQWKGKIHTELILGEELSTTEEEQEESEGSDDELDEVAQLLTFEEDDDSGVGGVEDDVVGKEVGEPLDSGWRDALMMESEEDDDSDSGMSGSMLRFLLSDESEDEIAALEPEPALVSDIEGVPADLEVELEDEATDTDDAHADLISRSNNMRVCNV